MAFIAVSGGIGAGKSQLLSALAQRGFNVVQADLLANECLETDEVRLKLFERYPELQNLNQKQLKANLAEIVFKDEVELKFLEDLIHPCVQTKLKFIREESQKTITFVEVPILSAVRGYDYVVIVDAPSEVRINRLIERGMTLQDIENRIAIQPRPEEFLVKGDYVFSAPSLDFSYSEEVDKLVNAVQEKFHV
jgi:dephospho-CoA kinase